MKKKHKSAQIKNKDIIDIELMPWRQEFLDMPEKQQEKIAFDYRNNKINLADCAAKHKLLVITVKRILEKYNINTRGNPIIVSKEIKNAVKAAFEKDSNIEKLARDFGLTRTVVLNALNDKETTKFMLTENEKDEISCKYMQGYSIDTLSKDNLISKANIIKFLIERDMYTRVSNTRDEITLEKELEFINCYSSKKGSVYELSKKCGLTTHEAKRILFKNNIPLKLKKKSKISEEQEKEIIKSYKDRITMRQLASQFKIAETSIREILVKHGIQTISKPLTRKIDFDLEQRIIKDYLDNWLTFEKISEKYGITPSLFGKLLKENNVDSKIRGYIKNRRGGQYVQKILDMWNKGKSTKTISNKVGLTRLRVGVLIAEERAKIADKKEKTRLDKMIVSVIKFSKGAEYIDICDLRPFYSKSKIPGICAICNVFTDELLIDHDHRFDGKFLYKNGEYMKNIHGKFRDLLCSKCNSVLGIFKENPEIFLRSKTYLKTSPEYTEDFKRNSFTGVLNLWNKGKSIYQIADSLNINISFVLYKLLEKFPNNKKLKNNLLKVIKKAIGEPYSVVKNLRKFFSNKEIIDCCSICGEEGSLILDHAHPPRMDYKNGPFRGLLDNKCNMALGFIKDDPTILDKMLDYLKKHNPKVFNY